ncbi:SapC family protein [Stakelama marina]|uniref:SapC family protein n=1 Tax=Stakelama marina TaxID=2826939 RepID=A0A8T4IGJ6_9SPHN|nr:SapC family protein [Stakelama marina]MBR0553601.1 SapC family protein [Stakelama marina]
MTSHAVLTAEDHRDLRIRTERAAELGDGVMCCITVPQEFRRVQNEYPILFRRSADRDSFTALAMFGFENGENLFLEGGRWDARYRPLAIDIQPFLIGREAPDSEARQVHVDMASPRIADGEGVRVFDEDGRPTPYLETVAEQLGALDVGFQASGEFFAALGRFNLLEPLTLEITLDDGSTNRLVGFHVIDEDRLRALDASALGELQAADHLMPIFMALASLGNLDALIARKNKRQGHG